MAIAATLRHPRRAKNLQPTEGASDLKTLAAILVSAFLFLALPLGAAVFNVTDAAQFQTALTTAAANGVDDTINLAAGTYETANNGAATFTYVSFAAEDLVIDGAGTGATILDGNSLRRVLYLLSSSTADLTLRNLTLRNAAAAPGALEGGGLRMATGGTARVSSIAITGVIANVPVGSVLGGVAFIDANGITIEDSSFTNNQITQVDGASIFGGIIRGFAASGDLSVVNVQISGNTVLEQSAGDLTGGLGDFIAQTESVAVYGITFSNNTVSEEGDGNHVAPLRLNGEDAAGVRSCTFDGNQVSEAGPGSLIGGAIYLATSGFSTAAFAADNVVRNMTVSEADDGSIVSGLATIVALGNFGQVIARDNRFTSSTISESSTGDITHGAVYVSMESATDATAFAIANVLSDIQVTEDGQGVDSGGLVLRADGAGSTTSAVNNVVMDVTIASGGPITAVGMVVAGAADLEMLANTIVGNTAAIGTPTAGGAYVSSASPHRDSTRMACCSCGI